MASEESSNTSDVIVGSMVRFEMSGELFKGIVYFFDPVDASFGIEDVSRGMVRENYRRVEGCYQFFLKDIKNLRVLVPGPKPTTTNTKDDQKNDPGDASSSNTKDGQKGSPGDASSSTSPTK